MSGYQIEHTYRSIFPPNPARWFWVRLKLYLAILVASVTGFFFFAGWYAAPSNNKIGELSLLGLIFQIANLIIGASSLLVARHEKYELDKQDG